MSRPGCDVLVVGLGVAGSAAARELARRGLSVVGLDRFGPDHRRGSSHGESRLFRLLYHEASHYVPLLRRARAAWMELEEEAGRELLLETGGLAVGPPGGTLVTGCLSTAAEHGLAFERLTPVETRRRFPAFRPGAEQEALVDPAAGVLRADRCVAALRAGARRAGAELRFREPVRGWRLRGDGLTVETGGGELRAGALLVAAGGWTADLLEEAGEPRPPLTVERQTVHRFPAPGGGEYGPERFPVFLLERGGDAGPMAYGVPDLGRGVKVAVHHDGEQSPRPEDVRRRLDPDEAGRTRSAVDDLLPGLGASPLDGEICLYTDTPDRDFLIDRLGTDDPPVVVATGFSGHGFKFGPVVGRVAADLLTGERPEVDTTPFRLGRWSG